MLLPPFHCFRYSFVERCFWLPTQYFFRLAVVAVRARYVNFPERFLPFNSAFPARSLNNLFDNLLDSVLLPRSEIEDIAVLSLVHHRNVTFDDVVNIRVIASVVGV